jgi:uncharacterized membrane protein YdcZ (DUF606 family)
MHFCNSKRDDFGTTIKEKSTPSQIAMTISNSANGQLSQVTVTSLAAKLVDSTSGTILFEVFLMYRFEQNQLQIGGH